MESRGMPDLSLTQKKDFSVLGSVTIQRGGFYVQGSMRGIWKPSAEENCLLRERPMLISITYMAPYRSKSVSDLMHCSLSQPNFVNEDTGPRPCAVTAKGAIQALGTISLQDSILLTTFPINIPRKK